MKQKHGLPGFLAVVVVERQVSLAMGGGHLHVQSGAREECKSSEHHALCGGDLLTATHADTPRMHPRLLGTGLVWLPRHVPNGIKYNALPQTQLACTSWMSGQALRASSPRMLRFTP